MIIIAGARIRQGAVLGSLIGGGVLTLSAIVFYFFERGSPDVRHIGHGFLWVTRTLLQQEPPWEATTGIGHFLYYVVVITGVGIVAILTGAIASKLLEVLMRKDAGLGEANYEGHVLICGWSPEGEAILRELHAEEVTDKRPVVILADLERTPVDDDLVTFIRGAATSSADLRRAAVDRAHTAIVLADRTTPGIEGGAIDAKTLLSALAIESENPHVYTCVEVIDPSNVVHLSRAKVDEMVVSAEVTGALLASSATDHGMSRVITDLTTHAAGQELYATDVAPTHEGLPFAEVVTRMKQERNVLVIAVSGEDGEFEINPPSDRAVRAGERLLVIAENDGEARGEKPA